MSASPADQTPGRTPNGGLQPVMRRPKQADPLVRPKDRNKRPKRPPGMDHLAPSRSNGLPLLRHGQTQVMPQHPGRPIPALPRPLPVIQDGPDPVSGFTSPAVAPYTDYPLVMTKGSLMQLHHVAKFASKKTVDPRNTEEFVRPVRLHRRDPRAPPAGGGSIKAEDTEMGGVDPKVTIDDKERERQEILRAERDALREAELAQVAPSANSGGQKKVNVFKKKTQQIFRNDQTDEQRAGSKLRYEEALPWHLEDFEGSSIWVGSYEAALSETFFKMERGQDDVFRMEPLNKWYKFTPKNQFKTLTIEEAESRMGKKFKDPRWFMQSLEATKEQLNEQKNKKATKGLFLGKWEKEPGGGGSAAPRTKQEQADADDLDFQGDQFADDEGENVIEGEDEETKQAEERIKRDQLQANIFDLKEEKEYDLAEQEERKEKEAEKKLGKGVKKALKRREKNYIYDSDSADNPYSEESDSDDTETERLKEEERKKEEEKKPNPSDIEKGVPAGPSKISSGASSKGNNTPSHRPSKHSDPTKKLHSTSNALKRPGSPNLSEASGTESTRKKQKKEPHSLPSSQLPSLQPPSRPTSPVHPTSSAPELNMSRPALSNSRVPSSTRLPADAILGKASRSPSKGPRSHAGSGSDNEAVGSGAEKSDGTRQRLKLKFGKKNVGQDGSTPASRADSPEIRGGGQETAARSGQTGGFDDPTTAPFPTAAELRAHIPPSGIKVGELLAYFKGQVVGEERKARFTALMRENSRYDRPSKLLKPL